MPNGPIIVETGSRNYLPLEGEGINQNIEEISSSGSHCSASQPAFEILDSATLVMDLDSVLEASNDSAKLKHSHQAEVLNSNDVKKPQYDFSALPFSSDFLPKIQSTNLVSLQLSSLVKLLLPLLFRILFFLPWCVAVGGTIVMFPQHLEFITFGPGYLKSPKGIHRFAHWADMGMQHVWIFLGFLASVWWIYPMVGWMFIGGVVAQTANAWQDFEVDRNVPLGEDDRQTMYLVATQYGMPDELMEIRKMEGGYVVSRLGRLRMELRGLDDDEEEE